MRDGGTLVEMERSPYPTEDTLQELLHRHPEILASVNPDSPRRWLAVSRELPIASEEGGYGRWSADHLFLDQDAIPTIVEDKRSSDSRIRREVVGQMFDYAANVVAFGPVTALHETYQATCAAEGHDPDEDVRALLGPDGDIVGFWRDAETNVRAGRIRMVFVADEVPPELKGVVEFLNRQMSPAEVLAVEVPQYVDRTGLSGLKTLVPVVYGRTVQSQAVKGETPRSTPGTQWDEDRFFAKLADRPPVDADVAKRIMQWCRRRGLTEDWGKGVDFGSWYSRMQSPGEAFNWLTLWTSGTLEINFWQISRGVFGTQPELTREFFDRLNNVNNGGWDSSRMTKRPSFRYDQLADEAVFAEFVAACEWFTARAAAVSESE